MPEFWAFKSNDSLRWLAAQSYHTQLFWDKLIQTLIFAPEISPDQGKLVSDLGDKAQAFYL